MGQGNRLPVGFSPVVVSALSLLPFHQQNVDNLTFDFLIGGVITTLLSVCRRFLFVSLYQVCLKQGLYF